MNSRATIDDLHNVEGQAELIAGRIVQYPLHTAKMGRIIGRIVSSIGDFAEKNRNGEVFMSTVGYAVPELPSGRESFSPDASYYNGPLPVNDMDFLPGPPTFAVEVRSKFDYGPAAELEMAEKRADYFEAGTLVVWDVDPQAETVSVYRSTSPDQPKVFTATDSADAEPAMPGWKLPLSTIFS